MPFCVENYRNSQTGNVDDPAHIPCHHSMGKYSVRLARTEAELQSCLALRSRVFFSHLDGYCPPVDPRDDYAHHLIVVRTSKEGGMDVVGNLRLMNSLYKPKHITYYTEDYYDLSALHAGRGVKVELGRFCVDETLRSGKILMLLWKAAIDYLQYFSVDLMFGISSFPGTDITPHLPALSILAEQRLLPADRMTPPTQSCASFLSDLPAVQKQEEGNIPTLMRGYMKMGARISDSYYIDPIFNTIFVMLAVERQDFLTYLSEV